MNGYLMLAILVGGVATLVVIIDVLVKRSRERAVERERVYAEVVAQQVAEIRSSFDALAMRRYIAATDLKQRLEMAVLYGCRGCGRKPREVADVVVCCGDRSLALDHPDRFVIACVACVPATTRVRA